MAALAESFIFGLANSLHCAGMCGPLAACSPGGRVGAGMYHGARIAGYTAMGAVVGSVGLAAPTDFTGSRWIPFVLGGTLALFALGLHARSVHVPGLTGLLRRILSSTGSAPRARAAALGALTPLLPCGLLIAVYGSAFLAGSWNGGASVMFGFALGSLPVLAAAQLQMAVIRRVFTPATRIRIYRAAMGVAAIILLWRGWAELNGVNCCT